METGKFKIRFQGDLYHHELYDENGSEIYKLATAIAVAEENYPSEKYEIFNGDEGYDNIYQ